MHLWVSRASSVPASSLVLDSNRSGQHPVGQARHSQDGRLWPGPWPMSSALFSREISCSFELLLLLCKSWNGKGSEVNHGTGTCVGCHTPPHISTLSRQVEHMGRWLLWQPSVTSSGFAPETASLYPLVFLPQYATSPMLLRHGWRNCCGREVCPRLSCHAGAS